VKRTHTALVAMYGKLENQSNVVNGALQQIQCKGASTLCIDRKSFSGPTIVNCI
jgi:hypothetical protein